MLSYWTAGNRSSVDASNVGGNEEDETVVEPEQGNGKLYFPHCYLSIGRVRTDSC